ncbi:MAG: hypothetical protein HOV79_19955 [Hamadaea sp.]|nr:hypothetical protein [Hamadaea sp.]
MRAIVTVAGVILATLTAAGCSSAPEAPPAAPAKKPEIVQLLRQTMHFEYTPYANPAAMRDAVDVAVLGTVEDITLAVVADELNGQGALVVALRPTEVWKGKPAKRGDLLYFVLPRPKNLGIDVYDTALPTGSQVALFGVDHPPATQFTSGDPGVTTYVPVPQGLFLYGPSGLENVWSEEAPAGEWAGTRTLDGLRDAVRKR